MSSVNGVSINDGGNKNYYKDFPSKELVPPRYSKPSIVVIAPAKTSDGKLLVEFGPTTVVELPNGVKVYLGECLHENGIDARNWIFGKGIGDLTWEMVALHLFGIDLPKGYTVDKMGIIRDSEGKEADEITDKFGRKVDCERLAKVLKEFVEALKGDNPVITKIEDKEVKKTITPEKPLDILSKSKKGNLENRADGLFWYQFIPRGVAGGIPVIPIKVSKEYVEKDYANNYLKIKEKKLEITNVNPPKGPRGTEVILTGYFGPFVDEETSKVMLPNISAPAENVEWHERQIKFNIPDEVYKSEIKIQVENKITIDERTVEKKSNEKVFKVTNPKIRKLKIELKKIDPKEGEPGTSVTLEGNFGKNKGKVVFDGIKEKAKKVEWGSRKISFTIPELDENEYDSEKGSVKIKIWVEVGEIKSESKDFTVIAPVGFQ